MNAYSITTLDRQALERTLTFIASWSRDDAYDRFGTLGDAGPRWLARELRENRERGALVASDGTRIVGLLDYIYASHAVHFGVVVHEAQRRKRIGSALVHALLGADDRHALAECRADNRAAVALLRGCGFQCTGYDAHEMHWRRA